MLHSMHCEKNKFQIKRNISLGKWRLWDEQASSPYDFVSYFFKVTKLWLTFIVFFFVQCKWQCVCEWNFICSFRIGHRVSIKQNLNAKRKHRNKQNNLLFFISSFCFIFPHLLLKLRIRRVGARPSGLPAHRTSQIRHKCLISSGWGYSTYLPSTVGPHKSIRNWQKKKIERKNVKETRVKSLCLSCVFLLFSFFFFFYVCRLAGLRELWNQRGAMARSCPQKPWPLSMRQTHAHGVWRRSSAPASCSMARAMLYQTIQFI